MDMERRDFDSIEDTDFTYYIEDIIYADIINQLNSDEYFVENVEVTYISKEYLEELEYNSKENISTCAVWLTANSYLKYKCCRTLINLSDTCHDRYLLCTFLFISRKLESEPFFPEPCICLAIQVDCPDM